MVEKNEYGKGGHLNQEREREREGNAYKQKVVVDGRRNYFEELVE